MNAVQHVPSNWLANIYINHWVLPNERSKEIAALEYPAGEVITPAIWVNTVRTAGYLCLRVPPDTQAIFTHLDDPSIADQPMEARRVFLPPGEHIIRVKAGRYPLQYINLLSQNLKLDVEHALTADSWEVSLSIELNWKVKKPRPLLKAYPTAEKLLGWFAAAAREFVSTMTHAEFLGVGTPTILKQHRLLQFIQTQAAAHPFWHAIEVTDLYILRRQGSPQRMPAIKGIGELKQEQELVREKMNLSVIEAEYALVKQKEELERQSNHARHALQVQQLDFQRRENEQALEMQRDQVLNQHEIEKARIKMLGEVVKAFTSTASMNQVIYAGEGRGENLSSLLQSLFWSIPNAHTGNLLPGGESLRECLALDLTEVVVLPGVSHVSMQSLDDEHEQVCVIYLGLKIQIQCIGENQANATCSVSVAQKNSGLLANLLFAWSKQKRLKDIVLEAAALAVNDRDAFPKRQTGNGKNNTTGPLAG